MPEHGNTCPATATLFVVIYYTCKVIYSAVVMHFGEIIDFILDLTSSRAREGLAFCA